MQTRRCAAAVAWVRASLSALAMAGLLGAAGAAEPPREGVRRAEVEAAMARVGNDPDIAHDDTRMVLSWRPDREADRSGKSGDVDVGGVGAGLRGLFELLRVFVWVAGAVVVLFVLMHLRRWWLERADAAGGRVRAPAPTHVRDLDIRPESLPDDVGRAAWALWMRGDSRAALSLLYRGALSRLVHGHGVVVLASSTEGECQALCRRQAPADSSGYFDELVGVWLLAVYGDRRPADAAVQALCEAFDARLGRAPTGLTAGGAP